MRYHNRDGPLVVEQDGQERQASGVEIHGPSRMVFKGREGPQPHIWLETESPVTVK